MLHNSIVRRRRRSRHHHYHHLLWYTQRNIKWDVPTPLFVFIHLLKSRLPPLHKILDVLYITVLFRVCTQPIVHMLHIHSLFLFSVQHLPRVYPHPICSYTKGGRFFRMSHARTAFKMKYFICCELISKSQDPKFIRIFLSQF